MIAIYCQVLAYGVDKCKVKGYFLEINSELWNLGVNKCESGKYITAIKSGVCNWSKLV